MKAPHRLRILLSNAFGLQSKLGELSKVAKTLSPDVVIITETKFTADKVSQAEGSLPGYCKPFRCDRTAHGGGVAIWVKSQLAAVRLEKPASGGHELVWISVRTDDGDNVVIGAVYRSGSSSESDVSVIEHLDECLTSLNRSSCSVILAGDFNVHNQSWLGSTKTTAAGERVEDLCNIHGLSQHVDLPTRGPNVLDLVMSDYAQATVKHHAPLGKSDHCVVTADFPSVRPLREATSSRTVWRYNQADWSRLVVVIFIYSGNPKQASAY